MSELLSFFGIAPFALMSAHERYTIKKHLITMSNPQRLRRPRLVRVKKADPKLAEALKQFGSFLPNAAGIFFALTGLGYFAGWREATAYYTAIGAPWIVSSLPAFSFLVLSAEMMVSIGLLAFLVLHHISRWKSSTKYVTWGSASLLIVGSAFTLAPIILPSSWFSPSLVWTFEQTHARLMFGGTGLMLGEAILQFRKNNLQWSPAIAYTIYLFSFYGLYVTPADIGAARARFHLNAGADTLPVVAAEILGNTNERWHLVTLIGQSALLVEMSMNNSPSFRLIESKDIRSIHQSHDATK
jgi:hypothetical protein